MTSPVAQLPRKPLFLQGTVAVPVKTSAEDTRVALGGLWTPEGTDPIRVRSGIVAGGGNPLAVTSPSAGNLSIAPGRLLIQGPVAGQGAYLGAVTAALTRRPADYGGLPTAGQFKSGTIYARVYDQNYGDTVDGWGIELLLSASQLTANAATAAMPAVPAGGVLIKNFVVTSAGAFTFSGVPKLTVPLGSVLPIDVSEAAVAGSYADQYRSHPTEGLQRWSGTAWGPVQAGPAPIPMPLVGASGLPGVRAPHLWRQGRTVFLAGVAYIPTLLNSGGRVLLGTIPDGYRTPAAPGQLVLPCLVNGWINCSLDVFSDGRLQFRNDTGGQVGGNGTSGSWYSLDAFWSVD